MNNKRQIRLGSRFVLQAALSVAVATSAFGVHQCLAANIPALLNTGVDNAGFPLAEGDLDLNWEIILIDRPAGEDPVPPEDPFVQDQSGGFPIGPWLDDAADFDGDVPSDSRWITPSESTNGPEADYHYEITFDMSLFDPSTAVINGGWSTDNPGVDIIVNGTSTGQTQGTSFVGWEPFDIPANLLLPGENSIVFVPQNAPPDDNPVGLRVDFAVKEADPLFLLGDFNNDTMIDTLDFEVMLANFLTGTTHSQGDMQLDNDVDLDDFNLFVGAFNDFNGGGAPTSVPEPGTLVLAAMALMLLPCGPRLWRRR